MTLAELGAKLREERVSLGLTVEDVAMRLKVPARILRAIEEGDSADLPHTVYTRGFIKGYGLILGYAGDTMTEMLDSLEDFSEDFSSPKTLEAQTDMDGKPLGKRHGFGLVLKLLVVAVLCAGGYGYYTHTYRDEGLPQLSDFVASAPEPKSVSKPADPVKPAESDANVAPAAPWASPQASPSTSSHPASASAPTVTAPSDAGTASGITTFGENAMAQQAASPLPSVSPSAATLADPTSSSPALASSSVILSGSIPNSQRTEADPVKPSGLQTLPASSTPAEAPSNSEDVSSMQLSTGMHQIVLTAEAECWVHANADGTDTRQFSLKAGETFAMPFKKSMVLKLGNAGGVKIKYDGVELPPQGASGQVKTVTLPPKA